MVFDSLNHSNLLHSLKTLLTNLNSIHFRDWLICKEYSIDSVIASKVYLGTFHRTEFSKLAMLFVYVQTRWGHLCLLVL